MNILGYLAARLVIGLLGLLPNSAALGLLNTTGRVFAPLLRRYRTIALKNLRLAFPDKGSAWHEEVLSASISELARLVADFARLPRLNDAWISENVDMTALEIAKKQLGPGKPGVIFATGHLGSFELLAFAIAIKGVRLSFIVRNFKNKILDKWWNARRALLGSRAISRDGAFGEAIKAINSGESVGILFDQNITINHAVFVDFFKHKAATTKIVALLALRTQAPVVVTSITHLGAGKYRANFVECDFRELYTNENLSKDEKIVEITQRISAEYEKMIAADPPAWFWMHRRWRTRPAGEGNLYANLT